MPNASGAFSAAAATNTAAMPTSEWNAATSCGSAVIWMRCATTAPIEPPMTMPTHDQHPGGERHAADAQQRGDHRDRHADHAEQVAAAGGLRIGQAAQRQDEQDAGDEIAERGQVGDIGVVLLLSS